MSFYLETLEQTKCTYYSFKDTLFLPNNFCQVQHLPPYIVFRTKLILWDHSKIQILHNCPSFPCATGWQCREASAKEALESRNCPNMLNQGANPQQVLLLTPLGVPASDPATVKVCTHSPTSTDCALHDYGKNSFKNGCIESSHLQ